MHKPTTYAVREPNYTVDGNIPPGASNGFQIAFVLHTNAHEQTFSITLTNLAAVYLTMQGVAQEPYDWLWSEALNLIEKALSKGLIQSREYYILLEDVKRWSKVELADLSPSPRPSAHA
ncbi:hypothetical protein [Alicyclobacillus fastidiosus]|uniref:DUF3870 domain-containing protein n=1 Tax=Alicyclobacillus fastidiosus TaxID=392011 RepID=A0ABV5AE24_9BACL|nr:hypothetical protein [Alicyclobacillus fastidiosus]WEH11398.1 hypothetical protein PYS47_09375 [Alicyclobacillus fastidiosus]